MAGQRIVGSIDFRVVHGSSRPQTRRVDIYEGETAMDAFKRAFNVVTKDHKLGEVIESVNGIRSSNYHFFVVEKDEDGRERKGISYVETGDGIFYTDLRNHTAATFRGRTIEIALVDSRADLPGLEFRVDTVFGYYLLDVINDVCPATASTTKDGKPLYSFEGKMFRDFAAGVDQYSNYLAMRAKTLADAREKLYARHSFGAIRAPQQAAPSGPQPFQRQPLFGRRIESDGFALEGVLCDVTAVAPIAVPTAASMPQQTAVPAVNLLPAAFAATPAAAPSHMPRGKGRKNAVTSVHTQIPGSQDGIVHSKKLKPIPISSLKNFKAAIFDLDGVVVDSERAHLASFNKCLSPLGVKIDAKTWRRNYTGIGSFAIVEDVFRRNGIRQGVGAWVKKRAEIYSDYIQKNGLPQVQGFAAVYKYLSENGVKVAVASGGHEQHIAKSLELIGLPKIRFVGLESVKKRKPAPDLFLLSAKRLKVRPSQCIVFEDSLAGIEAAANAGMPCIALSTTMPAKSLKGKASLIVKNFSSASLRKLFSKLVKKPKANQKKRR